MSKTSRKEEMQKENLNFQLSTFTFPLSSCKITNFSAMANANLPQLTSTFGYLPQLTNIYVNPHKTEDKKNTHFIFSSYQIFFVYLQTENKLGVKVTLAWWK